MTSSINQANSMLARMDSSTVLFCDIESTGLKCKSGEDHAVGLAIADMHGQSVYLPYSHVTEPENNLPISHLYDTVVPYLNKQRRTLVWHNLKFDYQAWRTWGIDIRNWSCHWIDTQIAMYLLNEEFPSLKLDYLCQRFFNVGKKDKVKHFGDTFGWDSISPSMMDEYARHDVAGLTRPLYYKVIEEIQNRKQLGLLKSKTKFAMHLGEMERQGVGVNEEFTSMMAQRGELAMKALQQKLGFNPASSNELGEYLVNYLELPVLKRSEKTGNPSFNKEVMEKYEKILEGVNDESAHHILDYRGWQKATTSLYSPILSKRGPDGRIRTEFRQTRTVTGRLASAEPNLQQIPRWTVKPWNGEAKRCFGAGWEDFDLVGYDYAQLELRLGAAYGQDEILIGIFERDEDLFEHFANILYGKFNAENRYLAKNCFIYPMNYGAGKQKIASLQKKSVGQVEGLYDKYQTEHPGIYTAMKEAERRGRTRGYINYWTGRRRHCRFEDKAYLMWNSAMQGGAAELVELSMMKAPNDENCIQLLQVHDEIVFAIRKGMRHLYEPEIINAMTNWPIFGVPLKVEGAIWNQEKK